MTIYNPVRQPSALERAKDFYWRNRHVCDAAMFLGVVAQTVGILVAMA